MGLGCRSAVAQMTESRMPEGVPERRILWKADTGSGLLWTDLDTGVVQGSEPVPCALVLVSDVGQVLRLVSEPQTSSHCVLWFSPLFIHVLNSPKPSGI